jgi:hypothetical protein
MRRSTRLKTTEIKEYREKLLKRQKGVCPLCEMEIASDEATLDHSYDTGRVRQVLHRSCNGAEGQIKKWAGRRSKGDDPLLFLRNLVEYWEKNYSRRPFHPKHLASKKRSRRTGRIKRKS